jgi:hypothetical protein
MTNKDFDDFVTRQTSKEKEPKVNWKKRRKEWLNHLSNFYQKVEEFLNDYVVKGQISINYREPLKIPFPWFATVAEEISLGTN